MENLPNLVEHFGYEEKMIKIKYKLEKGQDTITEEARTVPCDYCGELIPLTNPVIAWDKFHETNSVTFQMDAVEVGWKYSGKYAHSYCAKKASWRHEILTLLEYNEEHINQVISIQCKDKLFIDVTKLWEEYTEENCVFWTEENVYTLWHDGEYQQSLCLPRNPGEEK